MFRLSLSEIAAETGGTLLPGSPPDLVVEGVGTDSRRELPGGLFVALRGARFDGHDHAGEALAGGAAAVLVSRPTDGPGVRVANTLTALQTLASNWRRRFTIPVVAITGSCGKTTVKEMLAAILARRGPVLKTEGNQNNHIGLPLTLLRLGTGHHAAVLEMGMNHPGELRSLTRLAGPTLALINNAAPAHLEGLGTVEAVAAAKGEILEGLDTRGIAVLNGDDPFADSWAAQAPGEVWRFSLEDRPALVRGRWEDEDGILEIRAPQGEIRCPLPLPGRHNGSNALAAITAALALGASLGDACTALSDLGPVKGRLQWRHGRKGSRVLDDSYNANPASLEAALLVLARQPGRRVLVLGDMGELGPLAPTYHRQAGQRARALGIDLLLALGPLAAEAAASFGAGAEGYESLDTLLTALEGELGKNCTVLVKGSRAAAMERVVAAIVEEGA